MVDIRPMKLTIKDSGILTKLVNQKGQKDNGKFYKISLLMVNLGILQVIHLYILWYI
jgi:hypothetical protein